MAGLTRSDAAKYLGMKTVEGVRYLERTGKLHPVKDEEGVHRFELDELERVKGDREARGIKRLTSEEVAIARADRASIAAALREDDAWRAKMAADWDAEDRLRAEVRAKNDARREAFEREHIGEREAGNLLGLILLERGRLRELVAGGLVRPGRPPPELVIRGGFGEPLREEEGQPKILPGAPFYVREDAVAVRAALFDRGLPGVRRWGPP